MAKQKKAKQTGSKRSKATENKDADGNQRLRSSNLANNSQNKNRIWKTLEYVLPVVAVVFLWLGPKNMTTWGPPFLDAVATGGPKAEDLASLRPPASTVHGDLEEVMQYPSCRFAMSESAIPNGGWGVFSLVDLKQSEKILPAELRIQVIDIQPHHWAGLEKFIQFYGWGAKYGQVEGTEVQTVIPGLSMLANGWDSGFHSVPGKPDAPEPGEYSNRGTVGAGSFTHYNNRQFFATKPVSRGSEILVNYGHKYVDATLDGAEKSSLGDLGRPIKYLREHGMCLDNIANAPAQERGRGAFATRFLSKDSMIAPLPVLPLNRTSLDMEGQQKQLLLNYCFGHTNSTLLLFPYSPVVNYINSVSGLDEEQPNAVIRWSHRAWNLQESHIMSASDILSNFRWGLLLEVVALRDIAPGEQILVDYGLDWQQAWSRHVHAFNTSSVHGEEAVRYVYPSRMNQLTHVRTMEEQDQNPYPANVETSCIYQYFEHIDHPRWPVSLDKRNRVTYAEWSVERNNLLVPDFLRPCRVLARDDTRPENALYTVETNNPWTAKIGLEGRIPKGVRHVVTHMPRSAIQFTDKVYSTDQNLLVAFRREIGLPKGDFPSAWMDLSPS